MPHLMAVLILYINLLNLSLIKISIFEKYGAFKVLITTTADDILIIFFVFFRGNKA